MTTVGSDRAYGAAQIREAEQRALAHATTAELMERAAHAVARECVNELKRAGGRVAGRRVAVLVGAGKNGGDAVLAAVHLLRAGATVTAVLCADGAYEPALHDFTVAGGTVLRTGDTQQVDEARTTVADADLVIDGIVGLGAKPGLRAPADTLVEVIADTARVVAVDIPSGVDVDTGEAPESHVRAHVTVTFSGAKPCHLLPPAAIAAGRLVVASVGIPLEPTDALRQVCRITTRDVAAMWPRPVATDHKYTRGVVGVVAGSAQYPGAAILAVSAAARAGAGMVRYVGPERAQDLVLAARPETVCHGPDEDDVHVQAWVVGPGISDDASQQQAIDRALRSGLPVVADAQAVSTCAALRADGAPDVHGPVPVLTPHAGELAAALAAIGIDTDRAHIEARPVHYASTLARATRTVVLLKGPITVVCDPRGCVISQESGPPWLATAGSGDVLAGIIGTLLAAGTTPPSAAAMGVYVHGAAAHAASRGGPIVALDVTTALSPVIATVLA